ncbi:hypothetical protein LguiA_018561 [Lonicera macranthoides]
MNKNNSISEPYRFIDPFIKSVDQNKHAHKPRKPTPNNKLGERKREMLHKKKNQACP